MKPNQSLFLLSAIRHYRSSLFSSLDAKFMNVNIYWSTNTGVSMSKNPLENVTYEFVLTSPAVHRMYCSSYGLWDGMYVALQLCFQRYCLQDLFKIAYFPSSFFSYRFVKVQVGQNLIVEMTRLQLRRMIVLFYQR